MTNYKAVSAPDIIDATKTVWYVTFADGPRVGTRASLTGYKNEESAKRRIRDLKRKEAEENAITGREPVASSTPNATTVAPLAEIKAGYAVGNEFPNLLELATETLTRCGTVQAGVYPAISKSERRRRWNYA